MTAAHAFVNSQLALLQQQVCLVCSGYGHSQQDCPTDAKIKHWTERGGGHKNVVAHIKEQLSSEEKHGKRGPIHYSDLSISGKSTAAGLSL